VTVKGEAVAEIGHGYLILLGVALDDGVAQAQWLAKKCVDLRIFEDAQGKMNLSIGEVGGEILVVSQFTLYGDAHKGRRPSFIQAAPPEIAEPLVNCFVETILASGIAAQTGSFGEHMLVELENDGPVTLVLERNARD
jgi:D-tyrosyl-tRNA(Tyr) deacylase